MIHQPKRWRDFYDAAFRERADDALRQLKVSVAMTICVRRLLEIGWEESSEREQLSIAVDDLRILTGLYKKYT